MSDVYLVHHGILGQKWGVRRFQNEDGSVTPAGALRYYGHSVDKAKANYKQAKQNYDKAYSRYSQVYAARSLNKNGPITEQQKANAARNVVKAAHKQEWARQDVINEKAKEAISKETKISKHRQKLEEEYRNRGMNEEEAAVAAYKRAKVEKILAISAGVAVTALAAYGAYKYGRYAKDIVIKNGGLLSRVDISKDPSVRDAFYAVLDKGKLNADKERYGGIYGAWKMRQGHDVFRKSIQATDQIKVASEKNGLKVLQNLVKTGDIKQEFLKEQIDEQIGRKNMMYALAGYNKAKIAAQKDIQALQKAKNAIDKGVINRKVFDAFNNDLVNMNAMPTGTRAKSAITKFYDRLKNLGYAGITDVNDKKYSGYRSRNPLIIFDKTKVMVQKVESLPVEKVKQNYYDAVKVNQAWDWLEKNGFKIGAYAGGAAGLGLLSTAQNTTAGNPTKRHDEMVSAYRKEHPNSQLTYTQIVRMLEEKE